MDSIYIPSIACFPSEHPCLRGGFVNLDGIGGGDYHCGARTVTWISVIRLAEQREWRFKGGKEGIALLTSLACRDRAGTLGVEISSFVKLGVELLVRDTRRMNSLKGFSRFSMKNWAET
jgi:hypothetical protein